MDSESDWTPTVFSPVDGSTDRIFDSMLEPYQKNYYFVIGACFFFFFYWFNEYCVGFRIFKSSVNRPSTEKLTSFFFLRHISLYKRLGPSDCISISLFIFLASCNISLSTIRLQLLTFWFLSFPLQSEIFNLSLM